MKPTVRRIARNLIADVLAVLTVFIVLVVLALGAP